MLYLCRKLKPDAEHRSFGSSKTTLCSVSPCLLRMPSTCSSGPQIIAEYDERAVEKGMTTGPLGVINGWVASREVRKNDSMQTGRHQDRQAGKQCRPAARLPASCRLQAAGCRMQATGRA